MSATLLPAWSAVPRPVVGMLHLRPLPGAPGFGGDFAALVDFTLRDAEALVSGGVHGLLLENFGDAPFSAGRVPAYVVTCMTHVADEVRRRFAVPLGINVLRNDGQSALAIAAAVGAEFIRVNILCGARVTDQGLISGIAYDLLRERELLRAGQVKILADVNVKHSAPLGTPRPLADEVADMVARGGADALVVSGTATGRPTDPDEVRQVKAAAGDVPVLVGSGVTAETMSDYGPIADGFIVGTSLKRAGLVGNPVDVDRVGALLRRLEAVS